MRSGDRFAMSIHSLSVPPNAALPAAQYQAVDNASAGGTTEPVSAPASTRVEATSGVLRFSTIPAASSPASTSSTSSRVAVLGRPAPDDDVPERGASLT